MTAVPQKDPKITEAKRLARQAEVERQAELIKKNRELFGAISTFCRERNAFLVSNPAELELRIDVPPDSTVVDDLTERGYRLRFCGINQRATPNGLIETQCFAFKLG